MPRARTRLRLRVALNFAWFGALISIALAAWLHYSTHDLGLRLIDETLRAEMQDFEARRTRNPHSLPPSTLTLVGYVFPPDAPADTDGLRALAPGRHEVLLRGTPYAVLVADHAGERFVLMFNLDLQRRREQQSLAYLAGGVAAMTLLSALLGFWLARRVLAPLTALAARVSGNDPDMPHAPGQSGFQGDEIDELTASFDRYVSRLHAFVERERLFTADVSHELRTPLAVIQGALEVIEDDPGLTPMQRDRIARIARACHEMAELTRALLHLAREENDAGQDTPPCAMAEVVSEVVEKHRHLTQGRDVSIYLELIDAPSLPVERTLATVVVGNLVRNAIAHTDAGRVTLRLENERLVVSDTGRGIGAAELGKIFSRYYRGQDSSGSGIGLSLVKRICDLYGWRISMTSAPGEGTSAELRFPAPTPVEPTGQAPS
ncbi:MAG: HAMP domain-containing sensor histidine kinase [Pseudomonadota bacterium]